ncbi:Uracil DNA glycosylase superfamily protein [Stieleria maiorica]|uniref:Uracil DNA glycosylase superfamily protein n=1 Tax=Stieleria maiorica TaxID=2795974 RepID=A0A5B9MF27_9BACT|nr:Uracil DNA glycosylase superfamily protein [Stieleria maiorica]
MSLCALLEQIDRCRECESHLPAGPRPVVQAAEDAKILIVGQAPGRKVHQSGIPWDDASGKRLRAWMGVECEQFYDAKLVGIMPMGFCYPGRGRSGDLPPRKECERLWHRRLLDELPNIELTLLVGAYAQSRYLAEGHSKSLTENVANWRKYGPTVFPLPHPSPRNHGWLKANPWFEEELLPSLQVTIAGVLRRHKRHNRGSKIAQRPATLSPRKQT